MRQNDIPKPTASSERQLLEQCQYCIAQVQGMTVRQALNRLAELGFRDGSQWNQSADVELMSKKLSDMDGLKAKIFHDPELVDPSRPDPLDIPMTGISVMHSYVTTSRPEGFVAPKATSGTRVGSPVYQGGSIKYWANAGQM